MDRPDPLAPDPVANDENNFSNFAELHLGHTGVRVPLTSVSNLWPHDRHENSNKGIVHNRIHEVP
jgi:hypothetical protein